MRKLRSLSKLFRAAIETTGATTSATATASDTTLKHSIPNVDPKTRSKNSLKPKLSSRSKKESQPPPSPAVNSIFPATNLEDSESEDSEARLETQDIEEIINEESDDERVVDDILGIPWLSKMKNNHLSIRRKEASRERKQKFVFKNGQGDRFGLLVDTCADKIGTNSAMQVFGKLGKETGLKEFNALIKTCIEKSRETNDENVAVEYIAIVREFFMAMKEQGFPIEEETYGPCLMLLIEKCMIEEFNFLSNIVKDTNPSQKARLGYYGMLFYIGVDDKEKIEKLFDYIWTKNGDENINIQENYLLALCESNQKDYLSLLLETMDITKFSSMDNVDSIFKSLGRLSLESFAEKFLLVLKNADYGAKELSTLIFSYVSSIPNLAVEDAVSKFKTLHAAMEISPSSASHEKLVIYSCNSLKVHHALDIVEQMCKKGLTVSTNTINSILKSCEESHDYNLPNNETFRSMISLCVKMKDFRGAYDLLYDLKSLNLKPTTSMYNAIMAGYFREKNIDGALMVLKKMELANVKPDSSTYSYLIGNCATEEKINKYYEEIKVAGIQLSKQIYMALINAYAACGQFEMAKQVILDKGIPIKNLNEIKSVLVSALASHGQMPDALNVFEEIKEAGFNLEPKAVINLIEQYESEEEVSRLLELLDDLHDDKYWVDGCARVISYCIRHKHLRSAVDLLKQLEDRFFNDELWREVLFDEVFSIVAEVEPTDLQIGLDLLQAIKDELGMLPSRKSLDFLLSTCAKAKDMRSSRLIWKEYQAAGLPYNVTSYLRMYHALVASGGRAAAKLMLTKIRKDDPHVRIIIEACRKTYIHSTSRERKIKRKEKG